MIQDIPTASDFINSGKTFLNLSWDIVSDLYFDIHNSEMKKWDDDGSVSNEFWVSAQIPLSNALVLIQQGIEFLLKGRIAHVSPFLLLANNSRDWPAHCHKTDISFSDFRTINTQDLRKIHDTVCTQRLNQSFINLIGEIRRTRNVLMHSVDRNMNLIPTDIWKWILDVSNNLIDKHTWFSIRRQYLEQKPSSIAYSPDGAMGLLTWEALKLLNILSSKEKRQYLGVDPKRRWYGCINCSSAYQEIINPGSLKVKTCQLTTREPMGTTINCFVCGNQFEVIRRECPDESCPGDVIDTTEGLCLTCMESWCELE